MKPSNPPASPALPKAYPHINIVMSAFPRTLGSQAQLQPPAPFSTHCDLGNRTKAPHRLSFLLSSRKHYNYLYIQIFLLAFTFLEINLFLCHKSSRFCAFKNMLGNIILTSKRFFLFSLCSFRGKIPSDSYILNANFPSFLQRLSKGFLSLLTAPQVIFHSSVFSL